MSEVFCSMIDEDDFEEYGDDFEPLCNEEGDCYEFCITVGDDAVLIQDTVGRVMPIDITSIDQVIDALITARNLMVVPSLPDTYVQFDEGC
jgi:hypothetical protein